MKIEIDLEDCIKLLEFRKKMKLKNIMDGIFLILYGIIF